MRHRDTCFPFDPLDNTPPVVTVDPPVRTRFVGNIRLRSDEPAVIYATIDDSDVLSTESPNEPDEFLIANLKNDVVLRYFAIDLAGNQSVEQTVLWNIDSQGPSPPSDFQLTLAGNNRSMSWVPPTEEDYAGIIVARVEGRLTTEPIAGTAYATGDEIGPGITVVSAGGPEAATMFAETQTVDPGIVRYVAWAFDDLLNYGAPAGDYELVALPAQTGTLIVNATTETAQVLTPAEHLTFSGTATTDATCTPNPCVTAKITMRNDTNRVLYAPKVVLTNTPGTGVWSDPDGEIDTKPYRAYGSALLPGTSTTASWRFTNVNPATLINLDIEILDNRILINSTGREGSNDHSGLTFDTVASNTIDFLAEGPLCTRGAHGTTGGGFTPDGRAIFGSRCSGTIASFDLFTGNLLSSAELRPQKSHVASVVLDPSGSTGYALVGPLHLRNAYRDGGEVETELIRFDAGTLGERGRLAIGVSRNRDLRITADGKLLLIATGVTANGVVVVDLATFKIVRRILTSSRPEALAFSPTGELAVGGADFRTYDVTTGTELRVLSTLGTGNGGGRLLRMVYANATTVFIGRPHALDFIDLTIPPTQAPFEIEHTHTRGLDVIGGSIYHTHDGALRRRDPVTGGSEVSLGLDDFTGHWLGGSPF